MFYYLAVRGVVAMNQEGVSLGTVLEDCPSGPVVIALRCPRCGRHAELLEPDGKIMVIDSSGDQGTLHLDYAQRGACHRCKIATAPPLEMEDIRAHYNRILATRDRLGIPSNVTLHIMFAEPRDTMPHMRDFRVTMFGLRVNGWPKESPLPHVSVSPEDGGPSLGFVFPMVVVALPGIEAALEFRWSTEDPMSPATALEVVGWQRVSKASELKRLMEGVEWIRQFERGHRPRGSTSVPYAEFVERLPSEYAVLRKRLGTRPTNYDLAEAFFVGKKTFERYLREYRRGGGEWPPQTY